MREIKKKHKKTGSAQFQTRNFKDAAGFAVKIRDAADPVSAYIRNQLTPRTQKALESYDISQPLSVTLIKGLTDKINQILSGGSIYDRDIFQDVKLSEKTRKLAESTSGGDNGSRINSSLLQEAYPDEIDMDKKGTFREYTESFAIAIIAALIIRALFIQAFKIPTGSMEDTLLVGDFLLVNKFVYGAQIPFTNWRLPAIQEPESGDVVIFKYPIDPSLDYIKRCIAVGGQTVELKDKVVYVDGVPMDFPPDIKNDYPLMAKGVPDPDIFYPEGYTMDTIFNRDNFGPITVPENHLFMMGDNRGNSEDSRFWGFVPRENVVGEALIIYWSWEYGVPLYKFFTKVRWSRIANLIK